MLGASVNTVHEQVLYQGLVLSIHAIQWCFDPDPILPTHQQHIFLIQFNPTNTSSPPHMCINNPARPITHHQTGRSIPPLPFHIGCKLRSADKYSPGLTDISRNGNQNAWTNTSS
ncbi:hypothetical protein K435DRAFT_153482 [Dendrothele bispora CBS 962.96]|uniref:Uncharacterized protein n=1 Tax=Dendrothele bispora (strain CBS 962.96) TaxID=1314807 RepID=A0A4S8LYM2_DENBC|nr:hypothetical protein K435DRAFT_153482 [Dendrothele bispora CBS 962.96]